MVYGYYTKIIRKENLPGEKCPNCGSGNSLQMEVFCRVYHIMYVPCIGGKKRASIGCTACRKHFNGASFPMLNDHLNFFLESTPKRWYHFTGSVLLLLFLSVVGISVVKNEVAKRQRLEKGLAHLTGGSVVFYLNKNKQKTSLKVAEIRGDSIFVFENKLATNKKAEDINEAVNYSADETFFLKSDFETWLKNGKILDIY